MSGYAIRFREELRAAGFLRPSALVIVLLTASWSLAVFGTMAGGDRLALSLAVMPWLVIVLILAAIFARAQLRIPLLLSMLWTLLVSFATLFALLVGAVPLFAVIPAAFLLSAWLAAWRPEVSVILVFLLASSYGSLDAFVNFPVGEVVDLLLAGLWLNAIWTYLLRERDRTIWIWPGLLVVGAYLFVTGIQVFLAENGTVGFHGFRSLAWYVMTFILVAYAPWAEGTRRRIGKGLLIVALAVGGYATLRYVIGPAAEEAQLASAATYTNFLDGELGLFGSFTSRHELAAWCAVAIPFCAVFALGLEGPWRLVAAAAAGLCVVGLLGSEVRSALVGVVAGMALAFLLFQLARGFGGAHVGTTVVGLVGVAVLAVGVFTVTAGSDDESLKRYEVIFTPSEDPAFQARLYKWRTAIDEIDTHPTGHGLGSAGRVHRRYGRFVTIGSLEIDNQYLTLAYEQGLLLTGLFVLGVLMVLADLARRSVATLDRTRATLGIAGAAALVSLMVLGLAGEYLTGLTALAAWVMVGLGAAQFTQTAEAAKPVDRPRAQASAEAPA
jgi:hypothetical protein